jgi:FlaG protein
MDVTATSGPGRPGAHETATGMRSRGSAPHDVAVAERFADQVVAAAHSRVPTRAPSHPALPEHTHADGLLVSEITHTVTTPPVGAAAVGGDLKFEVSSADVLARFAMYGSNRVVVTMYDRDTGEVIRELPPRQVLDMMAAIAGRGLTIDVTT